MNTQILEAIKKKAEDKYPDNVNECLGEYGDRMRDQICYTSGQVDAINFMITDDGFIKWLICDSGYVLQNSGEWRLIIKSYTTEFEPRTMTTEELLSKYMESNL